MKVSSITRVCAAACALVLAPCLAVAEDAPAHSMSGCLKQGADAGTFELTDLGLEQGPKTVEITPVGVDLSGHVGHKVEITGTTVAGKDPAGHAMKVTAMKHLAATCP